MTTSDEIYEQTCAAFKELLAVRPNRPGDLLVVSCSISRVEGRKEDTTGDPTLAGAIIRAILDKKPQNMELAVQCCEHLNRALIVERQVMEKRHFEEVSAIPVPKAGGTFASVCWASFSNPVLVDRVVADLGIDIGLTMIGMHLKPVAKPILLQTEYIGGARVVAARTRPRLIGGERAQYK